MKIDCVIDFKVYWDNHLPHMDFFTTIVTILISKWILMKLITGEDADLIFNGSNFVK